MPFEDEERKEAQAKMANMSQYDELDCEYFIEQKEDFIQFLINKGIREAKVRRWVAENGVYEADHAMITKAINAGSAYKPPAFFMPDPSELEDLIADGFTSINSEVVRP